MSRGLEPPRYAPARSFPSYAYLPGRDPHPVRDPRGHSHSSGPDPTPCWRPADDWRENEDYLFGVDLYNHGYLWEAHEAWESIWHPTKRDALQAEFLQGLIQCSAAALKIPMEQPDGLRKLAERGTERLETVRREVGGTYMGLDLGEFVDEFRAFAASEPGSSDERPRIHLEL